MHDPRIPTAEGVRLREVLALAEEIGGAWRGDWSDFDGRTLRHQMEELRRVADGDMTSERYRALRGLCPAGFGHWTDYCGDGCRGEEANDA